MLIIHFYERTDKMRLIVWMFGKFEAGYKICSLPLCIFQKIQVERNYYV